MGKRKTKLSGVDPEYMEKQRASMRRVHRKAIYFNAQELAAIDEYCRKFKVSSRSALIRQATMERILEGLGDNHPTLF